MTVLAPDPLTSPDQVELELLFREARRRQRRRRLAFIAVAAAVLGSYLLTRTVAPAPRSQSLLARALHLPSLGPGGRCPVSSGRIISNQYFDGTALGSGPVRVLLADAGDIAHGRVDLIGRAAPGWFALQTLWFATPSYNGPFVVRGARLGAKGQIAVQFAGTPRAGPLLVPAGPTINTYYTNFRPGHTRDAISGRLVPTLTGYGYRTVPGGTWIKSPGCYAWQVDGLGFSETIVVDAL